MPKPMDEQTRDRVVIEYKDLVLKRERLGNFLKSDEFSELSSQSQSLLKGQFNAMRRYEDILEMRIALDDKERMNG